MTMPATIPHHPPPTAARLLRCDLCWCPPYQPCQRQPAGDHLERIITAVKLGLVGRAELAAIVGGLAVIADHVVILERAA
jgi:hypothetical protein